MTTPNNDLQSLAKEFRAALGGQHVEDSDRGYWLPSKSEVGAFCRQYLEILFPIFYQPPESVSESSAAIVESLDLQLAEQIVRAIRFDCNCRGRQASADLVRQAEDLAAAVHSRYPYLAQLLATDLTAALKNDPAASGLEEIMLSYPGLEAITVQRLAHELYKLKVPYLPRIMTELAHSRTGIDIHPGATVGGDTRIGHHSIIGGNVWLTHSVAPYSRVAMRDPELIIRDNTRASDREWFIGSAI